MQKKYWLIGIGVVVVLIAMAIFYFRPKEIINSIPNNPTSQICQKIQQDGMKYSCLAQINNDEKYCNRLDSNPKNVCLAAFKKDASFCQNVSQNSRQYCYQNLVSASGNASSCDRLGSPQEISSCYVHFVSTNFFISNLIMVDSAQEDLDMVQ